MNTFTKTMVAKTLPILSVLVLTGALSNAASGETLEEKLDILLQNQGHLMDNQNRIRVHQEGASSTFKTVFVSSAIYTGDLGGLSGGDIKCQVLANKAGLDGNFKAWLSSLGENARDRLSHAEVPYALVDGTLVATDWDDLLGGDLAAPIALDENGASRPGYVMTGTRSDGTVSTYTPDDACEDWTSDARQITMGGGTYEIGWYWSSGFTLNCASGEHLYCVQQ